MEPRPHFTAMVEFYRTHRQIPNDRVPSYTLVNLRGGYWFWNKQAEVAISVFNTLNDRHRESPIGDVIKSRVMGWFTLKV